MVRHGLSTANREGRIQGQWDTELTAEGWRQAGATGRFLAHYFDGMGWKVNTLYSSDLRRAWHTAEAIGRCLRLTPIRRAGVARNARRAGRGHDHRRVAGAYPELEQGWRDGIWISAGRAARRGSNWWIASRTR